MALRILRVGVGLLLGTSGALMYAASWQRWSSACPWGDADGELCTRRQDHLYDFVAPTDPWKPVGDAAQLAGWSLLVLALAFVLLPWALTGRRPDAVSGVALAGAVLAQAVMGLATLRSGIAGEVVDPAAPGLAPYVWLFVPPALLIRFAIAARGPGLAAAISLVLATPIVSAFTYAIGPYDARPWWEATTGLFTVAAGICLLGAAAFDARSSDRRRATLDRPRSLSAGGR